MKRIKIPTTVPTTEQAQLVNVTAVAGMLDVSTRHVYRLKDAGLMPKPLKLGGSNRWDRNAILQWIAAGCPRCDRGANR